MQKRRVLQGLSFMRFLMLACCMLVFCGVHAQEDNEYQKRKISLQVNNETIERTLDQIAKLADVRFFFNHSAEDFSKRVTLNVKETELRDVVSQVLADLAVTVEYQPNRTIVLRPRAERKNVVMRKATGKVLDAQTGETLIGASVVLTEQKGIGVVTDIDGKFHLEIP